ncbi:hypothetical protein Taro_051249 [Colocasia esculenta]|uniref:Uncharacterized protein n=1 Tax=Colocasia esculenta TaxID=4460 RepID=A0A843XGA0_COLES|nr:hypothetical protein [Colocasia esculenta]
MCKTPTWTYEIWQLATSSGILQRLERSQYIRERLPHTGVLRRSTQKPGKGGFEDSLVQAEEGFFDSKHRLRNFLQASAEIITSSEEIVRSDSERELWLHVVGVVFLLVRVSRGEMSLGMRIRAPAPQGPVLPPPPPVDYGVFMQGLVQAMQMQAHTQASLQAQLEAQDGAVEVGWDEFVRLFRAKFVPEHIQDKME